MNIEEQELRQALRRVEPAEGFDRRVLARLDAGSTARPRGRVAAWVAAAAMSCASLAGIAIYRQNLEERKGMEARDQLVLALQITGKKLDAVRSTINHTEQEEVNKTQ